MQTKTKNTSLSNKAAQKERAAQLAKQRQQQQQLVLFIGAIALLVVVLGAIFISTRPPEAVVPAEASTLYEGIPSGTTNDPKYPIQFPYLGNLNAPVKIEEVSSFSCPVCKNYHDTIIVNLMDKIKAGDLLYVYMPTTLTGDYSPTQVQTVTQAAFCVNQQGKFWQMHEILFNWQGKYAGGTADTGRLNAAASALGVDIGKFSACMGNSDIRKYIDDSNTYVSNDRKMTGTPAVFMYVNGVQVQPPNPDSRTTPGSVASLGVGELRGIIESAVAAKKS